MKLQEGVGILHKAFDAPIDWLQRMPALAAVAQALDRDDRALAAILTLHMRLPSLSEAQAERANKADRLVKAGFNSGELRDERGRWTSGGGAIVIPPQELSAGDHPPDGNQSFQVADNDLDKFRSEADGAIPSLERQRPGSLRCARDDGADRRSSTVSTPEPGTQMKPASSALISFLVGLRGQNDAALLMADCFTFTLQSGLVLTYTNIDVPVTIGGTIFAANSVLVDGLRYRSSVGLDVDQQQITLSASPDVTLNGAPFLVALRDGAFDGALMTRDRAFFSDRLGGSVVGSVNLFTGRLSTVDEVGRTSAKITVQSDLILLDLSMPRNLYQPTCLHTLYDSGCGLVRNAFATNATIGAGSTVSLIDWSGTIAGHAQGRILFTSGVNANVSATVSSVVPGSSLQLRYPLPDVPATGDAFTIYQGCDHTMATCQAQFNNLARFRGFPFVPPPEVAF